MAATNTMRISEVSKNSNDRNGVVGDIMFSLTEGEQAFLWMIRKHLLDHRHNKSTGKLAFETDMCGGGLSGMWSVIKLRENK